MRNGQRIIFAMLTLAAILLGLWALKYALVMPARTVQKFLMRSIDY
jgi:hypothetical protein